MARTRAGRWVTKAEGSLAVLGSPSLLSPSSLPGHRILSLSLLNGGRLPVELRSDDIELYDTAGAALHPAVSFAPGARGMRNAVLEPGQTIEVVLVYRTREGGSPPARLEYSAGELDLTSAPLAPKKPSA